MEVKDILKSRGQELNLTMKEVAASVGVNEGTISRWESGDIANMKRDKIMALAKALQISPAVIMGWDDGSTILPAKDTSAELRNDERELLSYYNQLNDTGKAKAISNMSDMTEIRKYTEDTASSNA